VEAGELPSTSAAIDAFNERAFGVYNTKSLVPCRLCGRTFLPESLAKHEPACKGGPGGARVGVSSSGSGGGGSGGGLAPTGTLPFGKGAGGGPAAKPRGYTCFLCGQQFGSASLTIHTPQCRKRLEEVNERLAPGERRTLPPEPAELSDPLPTRPDEIDAFNDRMFQIYNAVVLVPCATCGRTFLPESLRKHAPACKGR
jgi:DNA-directed RNA polymerase subunit RPC12/RpoP